MYIALEAHLQQQFEHIAAEQGRSAEDVMLEALELYVLHRSDNMHFDAEVSAILSNQAWLVDEIE
jgi:hypothetical protein